MSERIWKCKIGGEGELPDGADWPMRKAIKAAFKEITGNEDAFCFSGWSAMLTEPERAVVENRGPRAAEAGVRSATHAENLMILRARLSEHLSPAEYRELLAAAAALSSRPAIIEECARVCEQDYTKFDGTPTELGARFASTIRALRAADPSLSRDQIEKIVQDVEGEWQMGGLSSTMYSELAWQVYLRAKVREAGK